MTDKRRRWLWVVCCLPMLAGAADPVEQARDTVTETNQADAASQDRIDRLSEETRRMLDAYREAVTRTQQLQVYNRELDKIVAEQERRKQALQNRIDRVGDLREQVEPLMLRMIDGLERFVEADLPFSLAERRERVAGLREAVANPELNVAERFRRVLEAYQTEAEYGRTMGTYRGEVEMDGSPRLVEFLRVGRTMLFYLTPDDARVGYWDRDSGAWQPLPDRYRGPIREGIRVAKDVAAPQLIEIAVPAPSAPQTPALPDADAPPEPAEVPAEPDGEAPENGDDAPSDDAANWDTAPAREQPSGSAS
ncbi:DUF3450 domain-containing protein [Spectribacter hydrogenooxidans]|uniref:DUF3450 family protein n=1 Tax=Spectribacter hydrogenoxidans TaxID=3075608 RepID=A0ABU3C018_9GAMM|nr:DUF3450 family protein [Salinisphaera sp. W335]MDT0634907.1 DUF3450 family protein [Salinisphaera sp. W335]